MDPNHSKGGRSSFGDFVVEDFPLRSFDKLRYADTDRQGHVNNAVFATFLETGRVEILYDPAAPLAEDGASFVIANLSLSFRAEINWPGEVVTGTRVSRLGRSSVTLEQGLFQDGRCVAMAETVIVQVDNTTRRSRPLGEQALERLRRLSAAAGAD